MGSFVQRQCRLYSTGGVYLQLCLLQRAAVSPTGAAGVLIAPFGSPPIAGDETLFISSVMLLLLLPLRLAIGVCARSQVWGEWLGAAICCMQHAAFMSQQCLQSGV